LGNLKVASAIEPLKELLEDEDARTRCATASALGKLGDNSGLDVALKEIENEDIRIRTEALRALGYIGETTEPVVNGIEKAVKDKNKSVRRVAEMVANQLRIEIKTEKEEKPKSD
jgi:HEAT repeat protein